MQDLVYVFYSVYELDQFIHIVNANGCAWESGDRLTTSDHNYEQCVEYINDSGSAAIRIDKNACTFGKPHQYNANYQRKDFHEAFPPYGTPKSISGSEPWI